MQRDYISGACPEQGRRAGRRIGWRDPSGSTHNYFADSNGSAFLASRKNLRDTRTVTADLAYSPFGYDYAESGNLNKSFTGQSQNTAANLYDFMYREYGIQGRWPSPDPLDTGAFDLADPQSLDLYAYVRNSPMSLTDPLGLDVNGKTQSVSVTAEPACYVLEMGGVFLFQPVPEYPQSFCPGGGGKDSYYGDYGISAGGFAPGIPGDGGGGGTGGNTAGAPQSPLGQMMTQQFGCPASGNAPPPTVYQTLGELDSFKTQFGAFGRLGTLGDLYEFHRGGYLDAQVLYGGSPAYANYVYGVYMSAAGYSLSFALFGANAIGALSSHYPAGTLMSRSYPSIPASNVSFITQGYSDQANGTLCKPQ